MQLIVKYTILILTITVVGCGGGGGGGSPGTTPPGGNPPGNTGNGCTTPVANSSGTLFTNVTLSLDLCYAVAESIQQSDIHVQGGGLAMSDVDRDGDFDLYVTHGSFDHGVLLLFDGSTYSPAPNNNGIDLKGLDNAGFFVDIDDDGWDDFISIQYQPNYVEIFRNDGTGQFVEDTQSTNIYLNKPTYSVAAADYDLDGDVDLFFAHWGAFWTGDVREYLWQNDGTGAFTDVSSIVEIRPTFRPFPFDDVEAEHSFTPVFSDVDSDGWPDMLLTGDFESTQVLMNMAGTAFVDATTDVITDENGMGAAIADYDRDGDFDWFVSSIFFSGKEKEYTGGVTGNRLYRNDGGQFTDVTDEAGVRDGDWGWGSCFADFDNDGHPDIFHTNGMRSAAARDTDETHPLYPFFRDPSRLFMAQGDLTFVDEAAAAGINHTEQGRGVICTDYDVDGLIDILVSNNGLSPTVYKNRLASDAHWLQIILDGPPGNRQGIGAKVSVQSASGQQVQEVYLGTNYLSQPPAVLHFGLGADDAVTSIVVDWPGTTTADTMLEDVDVDQRIIVSAE